MNDQLPLDPVAEHFDKVWAIYPVSRRKEKQICLQIYRQIVSPEGGDFNIVRDGAKYVVHVQAEPKRIHEGAEAYLWSKRDGAERFIFHFQRFLKYAVWEDVESAIPIMRAEQSQIAEQKLKVSEQTLRNNLSLARQTHERMMKYGSAEDKAAAKDALYSAENALQ